MLIVRKPCELDSLRELLGIERAAVRLYDRAIASTDGPIQFALRGCRRSHVARALYLSREVRRVGGSLDIGAPGTSLFGVGRLPDDPVLLLAAFVRAERRGLALYDELSPENGTEKRTLKFLRRHQVRSIRMLETVFGSAIHDDEIPPPSPPRLTPIAHWPVAQVTRM